MRGARRGSQLVPVGCACLLVAVGGCGSQSGHSVTGGGGATLTHGPLRVLAKIRTGAAMGLVAAPDGIWLSNHREGSISRIDPATDRVVATVQVGVEPSDLSFGYGSVWAPVNQGGRLVRVDPRRGRIIASFPGTFWRVAAGEGGVWALQWEGQHGPWSDWHGRTVTRIDARTNRVTARIRTGEDFGIAAGEGGVWVTNNTRSEVDRIDPRTNRVVARIKVPPMGDHISVGEDAVWATVSNGRVVRIDPRRNKVIAVIKTGTDAQYLDVGEGGVWIGNVNNISDSTLSRIDPATNRVTSTIPVGSGPQGVAAGFGSVWVGSFEESDVWRIGVRPAR